MNIQSYENYIIYPDGDIYSKYKNRYLIIKPRKKDGYKCTTLCKNGEPKGFLIHRLVALHYIPNPENKPDVDHIDGDKLNNNVKNLRWVTNLENRNAFQKKRIDNTSGIKNIYYHKKRVEWIYEKHIFGKRISKLFKTKEEAIAFKTEYELLNPAF